MKKYKKITYKDYTFVFKFEDDTDMLHIWVRHRVEPNDAIKAFFEGENTWNEENNRFETISSTHTVFWFWIDEKNNIAMIITCFTN